MTSDIQSFELRLKEAGYSLTVPRRYVFEMLQTASPLTMQELYSRLSGKVDRTSVYRIVTLFEKLGISQRIAQGWKYKVELTDAFIPHHHHFTCNSCGRVISFDEPEGLHTMLNEVGAQSGFTPETHTLEIQGLCSNCSASLFTAGA